VRGCSSAPPSAAPKVPLLSMTSASHDTLVKVTDLVDRPGASRRVDLALPVPDGFDAPLVTLQPPVRLEGVLESVVDGILVRGDLRTTVDVECSRCLAPVTEDVEAAVVELFHDPGRVPAEELADLDEGYALAPEGTIDLDALLRDTLAPALPVQPRCREDCQGLCPTCGADRNEAPCDCHDEPDDPRWAALEGLRLPPHPDDNPPTD
jgi:uncharacterized protein